jgi:uncharacterized protein
LNPTDSISPPFGVKDGLILTQSARSAISSFLKTGKRTVPPSLISDPRFRQKMGCFVTLKESDMEKSLRGCIGFPEPIYELSKALTDAAIEAATGDPRFLPVKSDELPKLLLEVSLLTTPVQIKVERLQELPDKIAVGKDGLIMKWSFGSGLLLPQVATEYGWGAEEFLSNLSMKAGAPPDQWLIPGTSVYKFSALVFEENSPGADVTMY